MSFLSILVSFFLLTGNTTSAQTISYPVKAKGNGRLVRCGTTEAITKRLSIDPIFKAQYQKGLQQYEQSKQLTLQKNITERKNALPDSVLIPIVVHIALPNPDIITDADVQFFLDALNRDFAGTNADSTNGNLFYSVRGHSKIRFRLARRTSSGLLTNGIERKVSNVPITGNTYQSIKHAAEGGLDPWDVTQYYNVWVGEGGDILGISPNIGPGTQTENASSNVGIDGVCVNYISFAGNSCYTDPNFNLARTGVHEIGHNFGLYHIDGDDHCAPDFKQIIGACQLPNNLLAPADDTPTQYELTAGCISGAVSSGCSASPNPPGKMYQNYMDYTADPCYSMFTKAQVNRMEYVLEFCRPGYLTTQGYLPPAVSPVLEVAAIASVNPGGYEFSGCTITTYPTVFPCANPTSPKFRIKNNGSAIITSITVGYTLNGGAAVETTVSGLNIPTGGTSVFSLPPASLTGGINTFKFYTKNPNGGADENTANDSLTTSLTTIAPQTPISEGFENLFPPVDWEVINPNGDVTWDAASPGRRSVTSAFISNFSLNTQGRIDDLNSPFINTDNVDSVFITFDVAHRNRPARTDTFKVLAITGCGNTITPTGYGKSGATLATAAPSAVAYISPLASEWRNEKVSIGSSILGSSGSLSIAFRNISNAGNNIFLDNVNIYQLFKRDLEILSVNAPFTTTCSTSFTPSITVKNNGSETITGFKVQYKIDNGAPQMVTVVTNVSLKRNATATITLPAITTTLGSHIIKVYSFEPVTANGTGDHFLANDTLSKTFTVLRTLSAPLVENFTGTTFPPTNWAIINADASLSWQRDAIGNGNLGSAYMNDFNYSNNDAVDDMVTPFISFAGVDSVLLSFDLAAATFSYPGSTAIPLDTLEILMTKDCGNTYTSVYKKYGIDLQTLNAPNEAHPAEFFPAAANEWRRENIDLSSYGASNTVSIIFRVTNNYENNIFIDNVSFNTRILPAQLKQQGYLFLPNPFRSNFTIWQYVAPSTLQYITVVNAIGQRVWFKQFAGNADRQIAVDLNREAAGVYTITLGYSTGKTVSGKVIKY